MEELSMTGKMVVVSTESDDVREAASLQWKAQSPLQAKVLYCSIFSQYLLKCYRENQRKS